MAYSWGQAQFIAKDRVRWRQLVEALCPTGDEENKQVSKYRETEKERERKREREKKGERQDQEKTVVITYLHKSNYFCSFRMLYWLYVKKGRLEYLNNKYSFSHHLIYPRKISSAVDFLVYIPNH